MPIAFRMDDIAPGMRWDRFQRFVALFDEHGVRPLLGVVPDNRDPKLDLEPRRAEFWPLMRELRARGWSIAQHGYQHLYANRDAGLLGVSRNSEFAGLPYENQLRKITSGQEILRREGVATDVWMAPSHSFDAVTLRALRDAGFRVVSDGYAPFPYERDGLRFVPCQMAFPRPVPVATITACIHANTIADAQFDRVARFLREHRRRVVDFATLRGAAPRGAWNRGLERSILRARALVRGAAR